MDHVCCRERQLRRGVGKKGLIIPGTKAIYARGRITMWTPNSSNLRLENISDLARPEVTRIAIANPDHAPYGLAAQTGTRECGNLGTRQAEAGLWRQHSADASVC